MYACREDRSRQGLDPPGESWGRPAPGPPPAHLPHVEHAAAGDDSARALEHQLRVPGLQLAVCATPQACREAAPRVHSGACRVGLAHPWQQRWRRCVRAWTASAWCRHASPPVEAAIKRFTKSPAWRASLHSPHSGRELTIAQKRGAIFRGGVVGIHLYTICTSVLKWAGCGRHVHPHVVSEPQLPARALVHIRHSYPPGVAALHLWWCGSSQCLPGDPLLRCCAPNCCGRHSQSCRRGH
jgi:hypothetical protein